MLNRNQTQALAQLRANLEKDRDGVFKAITGSFIDAQTRYLNLCQILYVAQFNPPDSWNKMKQEYPVQYFYGIARFLWGVQQVAYSDLMYLQWAGIDDRTRFSSYVQFLSDQRLEMVLKMSKDPFALGIILNQADSYKLFFEVMKVDFFKSQKTKKAPMLLNFMKRVFSQLDVTNREFDCMVLLLDLFRVLLNSNLSSIQRAPVSHEFAALFFKLLGWFNEAKFALPLDIEQLKEKFSLLAATKPMNTVDAEKEEAAKMLLALGEFERVDSSLTQASKRVKLMAQPAVLFQPSNGLTPISIRCDKVRFGF